jgi:hypothetical protein
MRGFLERATGLADVAQVASHGGPIGERHRAGQVTTIKSLSLATRLRSTDASAELAELACQP